MEKLAAKYPGACVSQFTQTAEVISCHSCPIKDSLGILNRPPGSSSLPGFIQVNAFTAPHSVHSAQLQSYGMKTFCRLSPSFAHRRPPLSDIPMSQFGVSFAIDHLNVVKQFGRFPHRNEALGRATTAEEAAWLAGPDVPAWAKSQQKK